MSNDDTNEPTGARLTEADEAEAVMRLAHDDAKAALVTTPRRDARLEAIRQNLTRLRAEQPDHWFWASDVTNGGVVHLLDVLATTEAERAALVAENARLQRQLDSAHRMIGECADELTRVEDQNLAMRPLVERIAQGDFHEFYVSIFGDTCCIGCNATASTHIGFPHDDDCIVQAARALVATWQTPAAPEGDDA